MEASTIPDRNLLQTYLAKYEKVLCQELVPAQKVAPHLVTVIGLLIRQEHLQYQYHKMIQASGLHPNVGTVPTGYTPWPDTPLREIPEVLCDMNPIMCACHKGDMTACGHFVEDPEEGLPPSDGRGYTTCEELEERFKNAKACLKENESLKTNNNWQDYLKCNEKVTSIAMQMLIWGCR